MFKLWYLHEVLISCFVKENFGFLLFQWRWNVIFFTAVIWIVSISSFFIIPRRLPICCSLCIKFALCVRVLLDCDRILLVIFSHFLLLFFPFFSFLGKFSWSLSCCWASLNNFVSVFPIAWPAFFSEAFLFCSSTFLSFSVWVMKTSSYFFLITEATLDHSFFGISTILCWVLSS